MTPEQATRNQLMVDIGSYAVKVAEMAGACQDLQNQLAERDKKIAELEEKLKDKKAK